MNAPELLTELGRDGVRLWANGDRLSYEGPPDVLTPEVLEVMKASKRELMALLSVPEDAPEAVPNFSSDALQRARVLIKPPALASHALRACDVAVFRAALKRSRRRLGPRATPREVHDLAAACALLDLGRDPETGAELGQQPRRFPDQIDAGELYRQAQRGDSK